MQAELQCWGDGPGFQGWDGRTGVKPVPWKKQGLMTEEEAVSIMGEVLHGVAEKTILGEKQSHLGGKKNFGHLKGAD